MAVLDFQCISGYVTLFEVFLRRNVKIVHFIIHISHTISCYFKTKLSR